MNADQVRLAVALLAAHIIADFALQTDKDIQNKRRWWVLIRHSLIVASLSYLLCGVWQAWPIPLAVLLTHLAFDLVKARYLTPGLNSFALDQAAHLLVIVLLVLLLPGAIPAVATPFWLSVLGVDFYAELIISAGLIATVQGGSVIVGYGVEPFLEELKRDEAVNEQVAQARRAIGRRGFTQGGKVIGQLERAVIFVLVLAGQPSAIGFLIAAKSLLRFGDIGAGASRKEVEYIIIGTFMSFLAALVFSYLTCSALLGYSRF